MQQHLTPLLCVVLSACGGGSTVATSADRSAVLEDLALPIVAFDAGADLGLVRDWTTSPAIVQLDTDANVYAVGDVHGDFVTIGKLLAGAGLLASAPSDPSSPAWTGGNAVLVCTGDLIDKGPRSLDVLTFFEALTTAAAQAGGRVIVTSGNHEAELLAGASGDFTAELVADGISPADVISGAVAPGPYLRGLPFAARVNDWFFSHAGNTAGRTLAELNEDLQTGVDEDGWGAAVLSADDSLLEARLSNGAAPWWGDDQTGLATLATYAANVGAAHLVMGHQPGSFTMPDGKTRKSDALTESGGVLFFIDVGMSVGVDDTGGPLMKIVRGANKTTATAISAKGKSSAVWKG